MFKEGDEVIYHESDRAFKRIVTRATKTTVTIDTGLVFTHKGFVRGLGRRSARWIEPCTEDRWAEVERDQAVAAAKEYAGALRCACVRFIDNDLTDEEVAKLYDYLKNKGIPAVRPRP
jgi:hypothetical protein